MIAVVGPDRSDLDSKLLETAKAVAVQLVRAGYVVITRSGSGVSQTVARRTLAADGRVIAVTSGGSSNSMPAGAITVETDGPLQALQEILERADAAIILAPDVESLSLLCQIWAFGTMPHAPYRQVILLGDHWRSTVKTLADAARLDARTRAMVSFADNPEEAVESLRYYISPS